VNNGPLIRTEMVKSGSVTANQGKCRNYPSNVINCVPYREMRNLRFYLPTSMFRSSAKTAAENSKTRITFYIQIVKIMLH